MSDRIPQAAVAPLFVERWSPRAFKPDPVDPAVLDSIFEAARWAPSCFNDQPWLFVYAHTPADLARFRPLLNDWNQQWATTAPVLGFGFARTGFRHNGKPNKWSWFDTGAAWMSLSLQARMHGLYTHGMGGFHAEQVNAALGVPADYEVIFAFVIGEVGDPASLPADIAASEAPNDRVDRSETVRVGRF